MSSLAGLSVLILVGGMGTRLRSVVADRPKALAQINNRPFLSYLLDQLAAQGLRRAVLCTGFMAEQIQETFGNSHGPLQLAYSQELRPQGTAGAIRQALPLIESRLMLVMNGDSFCSANLEGFLAWHNSLGASASLYLVDVPDVSRYGQVRVDKAERIVCFEEKGQNTGQGWINAGIYLLSRSLTTMIPEGKAVSIEKEIFPRLIGSEFYGFQGQGDFIDIGTPESYARAGEFFYSLPKGIMNS